MLTTVDVANFPGVAITSPRLDNFQLNEFVPDFNLFRLIDRNTSMSKVSLASKHSKNPVRLIF